ncbi:MAG: TatD family hydrolase [Rhodospirillaceae bacterium]|nr:TatD family hydrolase [Rhodospirillaceae bacterium]
MIVDSHCHLDFKDFEADLDIVMERARAAGIGLCVTIGTTRTGFDRVRAVADRYADVLCSVGIHPHEAAHQPETAVEDLLDLARHPKVVGIGEAGLDYHYDHSPRDRQRALFRTHVQAACEAGLPLIVHSREADADTVAILAEAAGRGLTGVMHCFSGTPYLAERALEFGLYISFSGILTFKNAEGLRAIAREVPEDRLLVETDAPYLAPVPNRGKRNEPAYIVHTLETLAELKGRSAAEMAALTTANFRRLFTKADARLQAAGAA